MLVLKFLKFAAYKYYHLSETLLRQRYHSIKCQSIKNVLTAGAEGISVNPQQWLSDVFIRITA